LILAIFWIGIYPKPFFERMEPSVKALIEDAQGKYEQNELIEAPLKTDIPKAERREASDSEVEDDYSNVKGSDSPGVI
jgi:hypothetical protein